MTVDGTTTNVATLKANRGADGKISLPEAIAAVNNEAAQNNSITFDATVFPSAAQAIITVDGTLLPEITLGYTKILGESGVTIDGSSLTYRQCFVVNADNCDISGVHIHDFNHGIIVSGLSLIHI